MSRQTATAGAVTQMAAQGLADAVLTGNPQVTFWRFVAKSYTNFALESQLLDYTAGQANFGSFPKCNLDRIGDLVYWMYAVFDLPGVGARIPSGIVTAALTGAAVPIPFAGVFTVSQVGGSNGQVYLNVDGTIAYVSNVGFGYSAGAATVAVNGTTVNVTLTVGNSIATFPYAPYWTDAIGQALIESANFFIGGQNIDYMKGEFLFIWEELTGQPGKRLSEMTGRLGSQQLLQKASEQPRRLYVPLPFWFTLNSGLALPLVSLQFHSVAVSINIRDLNSLLKFSKQAMQTAGLAINGTTTGVFTRGYFDPDARADTQTVTNGGLGNNIQSSDLSGFLEVCYVYLDQRERSKFADGAFEQLMIEHQDTNTQVSYNVGGVNLYAANDRKIQYEINFNHTIIELYWVSRLSSCEAFPGQNPTGTYADLYNQWFKFDGGAQKYGRPFYDPVRTVQLLLNNASRFGDVEGRYFRLVQPWQHHTNIPGANALDSVLGYISSIEIGVNNQNQDFPLQTTTTGSCIYSYSFALQPEDVQPSGSCNFSRIDNTKLNVTLDRHIFYGPSATGTSDANGSVTFMVFATNWNILRFKYGLGGKRFAN
jgi:hypothetical protein